jgi:hypothetical protein
MNLPNLKKRLATATLGLALLAGTTLATTGIVPVKIAGVETQQKASAATAFVGNFAPGQNVCIRIDNRYTSFNGFFANGTRRFSGSVQPNSGSGQSQTGGNIYFGYVQAAFNWGWQLGWSSRPKYINIINEYGPSVYGGIYHDDNGSYVVSPGQCWVDDNRVIYHFKVRF